MAKHKTRSVLPLLTKITVGLSILTVVLVGAVAYYFVGYRGGDRNVALAFSSEEKAMPGVPFELTLTIENRTGQLLTDAALTLRNDQGVTVLERDDGEIGNIGSSETLTRTFRIVMTDTSADETGVRAVLSYRIGDGSFERAITYAIPVGEGALALQVKGPETIVGGSVFELVVGYENVSDTELSDVSLVVAHPDSFSITPDEHEETPDGALWHIGSIAPHATGEFVLSGSWDASQSGDEPAITLTFLSGTGQAAQQLLTRRIPFTLNPSPLTLVIESAGGDVANAGDTLSYVLSYYNQSGIALRDVTMSARLVGEMFLAGSLSSDPPGSSFDARRAEISWDKSVMPMFALLEPGARGGVTLTVSLRSDFPLRRLGDKNFTAELETRITSPTTPYYIQANKLQSIVRHTTKLRGNIEFDAQAYYRDASAQVANTGPFPPRVGEATRYTIHWRIKNYATDVHDAHIEAQLPPGVSFVQVVKSSESTAPSYNGDTRTVSWDIGRIAATRGVLDAPPEAVFQVEAVPTPDMTGNYEPLLSRTRITATDAFTGAALVREDETLSPRLQDDTTVAEGEGRVIR